MPTYVYRASTPAQSDKQCDVCAAEFEYVQKMSDDALTVCPKCGRPVERVITAPNLNGVGMMMKKPSAERMAKAGFTQYKRQGKGYYEKSFGQGPGALHDRGD